MYLELFYIFLGVIMGTVLGIPVVSKRWEQVKKKLAQFKGLVDVLYDAVQDDTITKEEGDKLLEKGRILFEME